MATARRRTPKTAKAARTAGDATGRESQRDALVVSGPPGLLRATVTVDNTAERRVAVRGVNLHRKGEPPTAGNAAALVPAGGTAAVPVSFTIAASTPPGEYAAELEIGGVRRSAVVRVEPHLSMHVSPRRLLAEPGRRVVELSVTNDGNVDVVVAARAIARTDDGGPDPGPDVSLSLDAPVTVAASASVTVTARLDVPTGLDPARRHTATLPVGLADLDVIILPRTATESPS
jgi:hypothetical protein